MASALRLPEYATTERHRIVAIVATLFEWLRIPSISAYGHQYVQPVDPIDLGTSPPFSPVLVDGECRARGAVDDKGQVMYQVEAARGILSARGGLPALRTDELGQLRG